MRSHQHQVTTLLIQATDIIMDTATGAVQTTGIVCIKGLLMITAGLTGEGWHQIPGLMDAGGWKMAIGLEYSEGTGETLEFIIHQSSVSN